MFMLLLQTTNARVVASTTITKRPVLRRGQNSRQAEVTQPSGVSSSESESPVSLSRHISAESERPITPSGVGFAESERPVAAPIAAPIAAPVEQNDSNVCNFSLLIRHKIMLFSGN